jgi:glycosidase
VLDFGFANAVRATVAGDAGTDKLARLFADDALYEGGEATALQLPIFISNHDQGRFAWFVRKARPQVSDDETLQRVLLANAMLFTLRGVPVVYYGDEQGFAGEGADQDARQDMMPSRTAVYLADRRIGGPAGATNFNLQHPIARAIAELAALRRSQPALRSGRQIVRNYSETPGLFAVSRLDPQSGREVAIAFNTSGAALDTVMEVAADSKHFRALHGQCEAEPVAPGSYKVKLAPFSFVVCAAGEGAGETG